MPRAEFRELLLRARPLAPKNQWVIDLAVAAIDAKRPPQVAEHLDALEKIRRALAPVPRPMAWKPPPAIQPSRTNNK